MATLNINKILEPELDFAEKSGFFIKDANGYYLLCSDEHIDRLQLSSRNDIIGRTDFDLPSIRKEEAMLIHEGDIEVIQSGKAKRFLYFVTQSDTKHLVFTIKTPLYDEQGNIVGIAGFDQFCNLSQIESSLKILSPSECIQKDEPSRNKSDLFSLSLRQYDCLYFLAKGMTAKMIAAQLNLSYRTVQHYLDTIRVKMNCSTRMELIDKAIKLGIFN